MALDAIVFNDGDLQNIVTIFNRGDIGALVSVTTEEGSSTSPFVLNIPSGETEISYTFG